MALAMRRAVLLEDDSGCREDDELEEDKESEARRRIRSLRRAGKILDLENVIGFGKVRKR